MKKLIAPLVLLLLITVLGYKAFPYLPDEITQKIGYSVGKLAGNEPQQAVLLLYEEIEKKNYKKASDLFASGSREFYNPEYLENTLGQTGRPKVSGFENKGKTAVVFYETENNQSFMANLIEENGQWKIKDIADDPHMTID